MSFFKKMLNFVFLLLLSNLFLITNVFSLMPIYTVFFVTVLILFFIIFNINPISVKEIPLKLKIMAGGYSLLISTIAVFFAELLLYLYLYIVSDQTISTMTSINNAIVCLIILFILMWNGLIRIICTSRQLSVLMKILIFFVWWIPLVNLIVLLNCCNMIRREYNFELTKIERNNSRKENEECKTKYPILLVHGIFWRDWKLFNYWGRIPSELIKNGATVYYGNQQSAAPMELCAKELKTQILNILAKENCEKVNIIAHSKGGLDARYAISCLNLENYVGSLTTICTPHQGSILVDQLLKITPKKIVLAIAKKYDLAYKKLGDTDPDFLSGIYDLTTKSCMEFNQKVINKESVLYQSVASKMKSMFGAGFPLNIGYVMIHHSEGENDGFVSIESSKWGDYLGCFSPNKKNGISHGDMIDLTRKNIREFDVCECYVAIVKGLKSNQL